MKHTVTPRDGLLLAVLPALILGMVESARAEPSVATGPSSRDLDAPFIAVFIDAKTEKALGPFPYERDVYAKAIDKAAASGAKGVVLKFFLDKLKAGPGDQALANSLGKTKVLLQARMDDKEAVPNVLPDRFRLNALADAKGTPVSGKSGWIPLPALSAAAYDIGFVDYRVIDRMPLVERYGDSWVKSLYLCCVELALDKRAEVIPGKSIRLGDKTVHLDERSEIGVTYPAKDDLAPISFSDFIAPGARPQVNGRIVILAYDSDRFEPVDTPTGKIRPHCAFYYALMSVYRQFR